MVSVNNNVNCINEKKECYYFLMCYVDILKKAKKSVTKLLHKLSLFSF